jgi:hypothetical protein
LRVWIITAKALQRRLHVVLRDVGDLCCNLYFSYHLHHSIGSLSWRCFCCCCTRNSQ